MRALLAIALGASSVLFGTSCKPSSNTTPAAVPLVNMTNLLADCQKLAVDAAKEGREFWNSNDALPPTIKQLSPQFVQVEVKSYATVVDIQVSGGVKHRGYLVVCASKDPNFVPQKGRNWRITKIAAGVFEYRE